MNEDNISLKIKQCPHCCIDIDFGLKFCPNKDAYSCPIEKACQEGERLGREEEANEWLERLNVINKGFDKRIENAKQEGRDEERKKWERDEKCQAHDNRPKIFCHKCVDNILNKYIAQRNAEVLTIIDEWEKETKQFDIDGWFSAVGLKQKISELK